MIHIGEHTLHTILEQHQRCSHTQCICGVELVDGLAAHLVDVIAAGQQQ